MTAVFNVPDDDQTQSADLDEGGSYAFDVQVVERLWREELQEWEDVDEYWLKYPYYLRVPQYEPGTTEPSHEAVFVANPEQTGSWNLWLNYYLHDNCNESAQWVNATILDPELEVVEVISDLPTAPGVMHSGLLLKTFSESELLPGIYRVILTAEDSHGDDHYSPANLDNPKRYREGENKRMLAANDETESPVHGDLVWADCSDEDRETMPGLAIPFNVDAESGEHDGDYLHPGPYSGENELRELRVRTAAPGCTLALSAPANTVKVWRTTDKAPAGLVDFSTPVPVSKGDVFWVEGVGFSVEPQDVVFTLVHPPGWPGPLPLAEYVTATVVGVTTVSWEAWPGNPALTANESVTVRLHEPSLADGVRIFPDHEPDVAATGNEAKVLLKAAVRPLPAEGHPLPTFEVYFRVFDIDDTSAGGPHSGFDDTAVDNPEAGVRNDGSTWFQTDTANCIVDENDTATHYGGDDNRGRKGENFSAAAPAGPGPNGALAVHEFEVSQKPGDNYRACASVIPEKCDDAWLFEEDWGPVRGGTQIVHPVLHHSPAPCTDPLTVWRRLFLETDSMSPKTPWWDVEGTPTYVDPAPPPTEPGRAVIYPLGTLSTQDENELQSGEMVQDPAGWSIASTTTTTHEDVVMVAKTPGAPVAGVVSQLRDDDSRSVHPWPCSGDPGECVLVLAAVAFRPAFIDLVGVPTRSDHTEAWAEYQDYTGSLSTRTIPETSPTCWTARALYAHQDTVHGDDDDPEGLPVLGSSSKVAFDENNVAVYVEVVRDWLGTAAAGALADKMTGTLLHELGHVAAQQEHAGGLMDTGGVAVGTDQYPEVAVAAQRDAVYRH